MKFFGLAALAGLGLGAAAAPVLAVPRTYVNIQGGVTRAQDSLLRKASVMAVQRLGSNVVFNCAFYNSNRVGDQSGNILTGDTYKQGAAYAFSGINSAWQQDQFWTINITADDEGAYSSGIMHLGEATIGVIGMGDGSKQYYIKVNRQLVGVTADPELNTPDFWAGTIAHEMLHNWGLTHSDTGDYDRDYTGSLVKEWELCVESGGGFPLNDTNQRHYRN